MSDNNLPARLGYPPGGYMDWLADLKYMRAFVEALHGAKFVQQAVALLPWVHNIEHELADSAPFTDEKVL